ncbi:hypothetical protein ACA910_008417 [Epithemia clementina (nom. ined.)]
MKFLTAALSALCLLVHDATTVQAFAPLRSSSSSSSSSSVIWSSSSTRTLFHKNVILTAVPQQQQQQDQDDVPFSSFPALQIKDNQPSASASSSSSPPPRWWSTVSSAVLPVWLGTATAAFAADSPDWGLFEGRTGSLIHPVIMGGLFLYTLYTAFLGFQWRRQRTMGDDIAQLKAQLPAKLDSVQDDDDESPAPPKSAAQLETEQAIQALQQERKDLAAANPRDKHFAQGAFLAFLGTAIAIEGCLNTYSRAGKLFPGPHLYGGAAVVVLWALAVSTVPAMQKGNDTARTLHIGANLVSLALFAWQVTSGIPILLKVVEITSWP